MLKRGFLFPPPFPPCLYLLASGPAASLAAVVTVTLGGLSSSRRDMASSVVVALFKRRFIDAMRVSNGALGIYRVAAISAVCVHCQGSQAPGSEKGRGGGWHGRGHSYQVVISRREADKELFSKSGERSPTDTNHVKRHSARLALDDGGKRWAVP
ncbi:hypothetical protein GGI35DRAFT_438778 [Trichoderma velutinum]